ncbi:FAD binding domain-containing protein [Candidatus Poriferisocius sp.]|uniref:FAD binding domain-containing protein n=1 Tax=Candidatus Poriferisocius sp. TaxID=3101276 RepID=UPI003B014580
MKNPPFHYHRPNSVDEALALLAEHGDDAKVLAGGQSLLPTLALRLGPPEHLIDIGRLSELDSILVDGAAGVVIGALVRHAVAEDSADIADHAPMVHQAMPHVGHRAIRNRGTVVGSIAHADPAAEMPAVVLATGAEMTARSSTGERSIGADEFFEGYLSTSLRSDELLTEVRFPALAPGTGGTVVEVSRRHGDYAMVGLACRVQVDDGTFSDAALAFFGVDSTPVRVGAAEAVLIGQAPTDEAFVAAAEAVRATLSPGADIHASSNYRRHVAGVLTERALSSATEQIGVPA